MKLEVGDFRQIISLEVKVPNEDSVKVYEELENRINEPNFKDELASVIIDFYKKYEDSVSKPIPEGENLDFEINTDCEIYVEKVDVYEIEESWRDSDSKFIPINIIMRINNVSYEMQGVTVGSTEPEDQPFAYFPFPNFWPNDKYDIEKIKQQIIDVFGKYNIPYMTMRGYTEVT